MGIGGKLWAPVCWEAQQDSVCVSACMCVHVAQFLFSPKSLKYLKALCLITPKSFPHLSSQISEDYHSTIALFGSKMESSTISRHVLMSTSPLTSGCILGLNPLGILLLSSAVFFSILGGGT